MDLFTESDIGADGCILCASLKKALAQLSSAVVSGKKKVQWGDRLVEYQSGSDLRAALTSLKRDFMTRCAGGLGGGYSFTQARYSSTPMNGVEGDERLGDIE